MQSSIPLGPSRKDRTLSDYGRIVRRDLLTLSIGVNRMRKEMEKDAGLQGQLRAMTKELDKQIIK